MELLIAMVEEWGNCVADNVLRRTDSTESRIAGKLAKAGVELIVMSADDHFLDGINDKARGVVQPSLNTGSIKFDGEFTTTILSHESLHLALSHKMLATLF